MSYWFAENAPPERTFRRPAQSTTLASTGALSLAHTTHVPSLKPTHFHREEDIHKFYPDYQEQRHVMATQRKRPGGESVQRMAAANDKLQAMLNENADVRGAQLLADWHSHQDLNIKRGEKKRTDKQLKEELAMANHELCALRRARLRALLEKEHEAYKLELKSRGLAIIHDEP